MQGRQAKGPQSPVEMIDGYRVQEVAGRGFRCRGPQGGRFVPCSDAVKDELVRRYGEAAVFGKSVAPKSPVQNLRGVRIQFLKGRGWRCRSNEGFFIRCPDNIYDELMSMPAPAGMEMPAPASRAAAPAPAASRARSASRSPARSASRSPARSPARSQQFGAASASGFGGAASMGGYSGQSPSSPSRGGQGPARAPVAANRRLGASRLGARR
jgi:hypothetical protein